jgi:hypothetical protein
LSLSNKNQKQGIARPKVNVKKDGKNTSFHGIGRDLWLSECKHFYWNACCFAIKPPELRQYFFIGFRKA